MKTKQMAYDAILTAMCVVLGLVSLDFGNLKNERLNQAMEDATVNNEGWKALVDETEKMLDEMKKDDERWRRGL